MGLAVLEDPADDGPAGDRLECPNSGGWHLISDATGQVVPLRCKRLSCSVCVLINSRRRSLAIEFSRPERAMLLTHAGRNWDTVRARVNRLGWDIRKFVGPEFQWVWHVEPNPSGSGEHHVHAWTHGAYVPQRKLSELADYRGMGAFARVNKIRSAAGASSYGLKGLGYGLKNVAAGEGAEYLIANGRRLTHQSRGYFRSGSGGKLPVREVEKLAVQTAGEGDPGPWKLMQL